MPSLVEKIQSEPIKMLLVGDPGSGKTGSLASLVNSGFKVRILDLDNNLGPLGTYVTVPSPDVAIFSVSDTRDNTKGKLGLAKSEGPRFSQQRVRAWDWTIQALNAWKLKNDPEDGWRPAKSDEEPDENLGYPMEWGTDTVLVLDSLSFMANAGMRKVLIEGPGNNQKVTGLNEPPKPADYGAAQALVRNFVETLASSAMKCHVICLTHLQDIMVGPADAQTLSSRVPSMGNTGKAYLNEIPRYFDTILWVTRKPSNKEAQRYINTQGDYYVACKNPLGDKVDRELSLETGLAEYFAARGFSPVGAETPKEAPASSPTPASNKRF